MGQSQTIYAKSAMVGADFKKNVIISIDDHGVIDSILCDQEFPIGVKVHDHLIAGIPNVHSHAFQRAMAGMAEFRAAGQNSFWSWRKAMYGLASHMTPERLQAIASQLYVEMLKAGYTSVGEFHYVHNATKGESLDMGQAVIAAAQDNGMAMTMLPVLYQTSDFGALPAEEKQKPFTHNLDDYFKLIDALRPSLGGNDTMGIALHSLRAVPPSVLKEAVSEFQTGPIHIHIAEQMKEVEACIKETGKRPVEWLFDAVEVNDRWTLVHATHMTDAEEKALAQSGAVAGICPTTEANLGDGFFNTKSYLDFGGVIAIGSDSHISVDVREELRLLEYAERLRRQERCVLADDEGHTGERLYSAALVGGAQSIAQNGGEIAVGKRADIVALNTQSNALAGMRYGQLLDAFVFSGQESPISDVMVAGKWVVTDGKHQNEDQVKAGYLQTVNDLANELNG